MAREVEAKLVISAQDRTAKAFASVEARLRKAEAQAKRADAFNKKAAYVDRVNSQVNSALLRGTAVIGGAFAAAGGVQGGLTTLTSYQDGLLEVRKKAGLTEEQMQALGKEVKALATSGELAVPLEEILSAYERGAAAGLPLEELREFSELSAKAADAFGMSAEDVGNAAAGFKVSLGIPMSKMEEYFDLINKLADSGISDEKDIVNFLDRVGNSLKTFGLSANDAAAVGSTLLNIKMPAETAARFMGVFSNKLLAPGGLSKKGFAAFKGLVGDVDAFQKLVKTDARAALVQFLQKMEGLDKFQRADIGKSIFGDEWTDELNTLVEAISELQRNFDIADNRSGWLGSLDESYKLKLDALSSRWQKFKNELAVLSIDVGEMGLPQMEAGLERAKGLVREINEGSKVFWEGLNSQELEEAGAALGRILDDFQRLTGVDTTRSGIIGFFSDLAEAVNETAQAIKVAEAAYNAFLNPTEASAWGDLGEKMGASNGGRPFGGVLGEIYEAGYNFAADRLLPDRIAAREEKDGLDAYWRKRDSGLGGAPYQAINEKNLTESRVNSAASWWNATDDKSASSADYSSLAPSVPMPAGGLSPIRPDPMAGLKIQIEEGQAANALRQAMEGAVPPLQQAGDAAAQRIIDAADALVGAADRIEAAGQNAAAALSNVRIQMPAGVGSRPAVNANLGQSMPNAGTPGG